MSQGRAAPPASAELPPARTPFPVEPEYRIRADLRRLATDAPHFLLDDRWPHYLQRKLDLLGAEPQRCRVVAGDEAALVEALWATARLLAAEHPRLFHLDDSGLELRTLGVRVTRACGLEPCEPAAGAPRPLLARVATHLEDVVGLTRLADAIALAVQEDLVLLSGPSGDDRAALLHVCFPSHWRPEERAGASFAYLHSPVPHNEKLVAGSRNIVSAMLEKGPFVRHVWSLTANPALDQHPGRPHPERWRPEDPIGSLWFRSERQTTRPLAGCALFTIRIFVAPLRDVLDGERAALLARSIRSMDAELLEYKSLDTRGAALLAALDEVAAEGAHTASLTPGRLPGFPSRRR